MTPALSMPSSTPGLLPMKLLASWICAALLVFCSAAEASPETLPLADAIATALADAGVRIATHVPASGAVEVFDAFCARTEQPRIYSYNEETAHAIAHGAAIGGIRSAAILKSHGFAKAANSIVDSIVAGNTAGFVVLVFHDATGIHSDSVLDTHALVAGTGIRSVQPTPDTAYADILQAFLDSEKFRIPVALILDSADLTQSVEVVRSTLPPPTATYRRDIFQYLLCPPLASYQHRALQARLAGQEAPPDRPVLPAVPDQLPPKFKPAALAYQPVFDAFRKIKGENAVVAGDAGTSSLYALPPYECVDITTYYGGSIPLAAGLSLAGHPNTWAICGDFAFIAAAHLGLPEALQRGIPLKILIFHNGIAAATGGQPIQPDVFENVLGGYRKYVRRLRFDAPPPRLERTLAKAKASDRLEIVVIDVP